MSRISFTAALTSAILFPLCAAVGIACAEALAWGLLGRSLDVVPILAVAGVWGALSCLVAAIGRRWMSAPILIAVLMAVLLGMIMLPYAGHAAAKLPVSKALGMAITIGSSVLAGVVLGRLARFQLVRVVLLVGAAGSMVLVLAIHRPTSERPAIAARGDHPDLVLIVLDTTRRDHMSLYGYPRATTPQIDRFAEGARIYDDAWSAAPWTPPSHATLFTGLLPAEHGVGRARLPEFPSELESLPSIFQAAGYRTAGLVANPNLLGRGWSRGFDLYAPPWVEGPHSMVPFINRIVTGGKPAWLDDTSTDRILARARRWWKANGDAPRLLFLNFVDPHDPYRPLEEDRRRFLPELSREASFRVQQDPQRYALEPGVPAEALRVIQALYDAELAGLDRRLGGFFDWLEDRGELDSSLIVLTSDHGERLGERGMLGHLMVMDQHLLRVPLMLRYPEFLEPERIPERVQLQDVAGEILSVVGLEVPERIEARSLSKRVARVRQSGAGGDSTVLAQHGPFVWYAGQLRSREPDFEDADSELHWTLVADRDHALLWSPDRPDRPGRLVALEGDPSWERDLWRDRPEVRDSLLARAESAPRYAPDASRPPAEPEEPIDEALLERLRALGYAE